MPLAENIKMYPHIYQISTSLYMRLNHTRGEVYLIQLYVIKFVSDLRQVDGFFQVLRFPPPIKLIATI